MVKHVPFFLHQFRQHLEGIGLIHVGLAKSLNIACGIYTFAVLKLTATLKIGVYVLGFRFNRILLT